LKVINLVIALECEARPLIKRLGLEKQRPGGAFRVYANEEYRLVISGPGYAMSAAGTAFSGCLHASSPGQAGWLNIGVAGHPSLEVGHAVLADKIMDGLSGRNWYPQLLFKWAGDTGPVRTVAIPESRFDIEACYDMEAAACFAAANRFSTLELIQSYKIISDNRMETQDRLNPSLVHDLVETRLEDILLLLNELEQLVREKSLQDAVPAFCGPLLESLHFTETERFQLSRLMRKYMMRPGHLKTVHELQAEFGNGRELLQYLREISTREPVDPV
jgi:adenosylhomocysteine nucleosidase